MVLFGSHWKEGDLVLKKATEYGAVEILMLEKTPLVYRLLPSVDFDCLRNLYKLFSFFSMVI